MQPNNKHENFMNPGEFNALYEQYHLQLYRTALLMTGSPQQAEDAMQDTFVAACLHIGEIRDKSKIRSWLFRILTNRIHRLGHQQRRELLSDSSYEQADRNDPEKTGWSPAADMTRDIERHQIVTEALQRIDRKHRDVLILYYYSEFSIHEIAQIQHCLDGTVKSRLYTAREQMRKELIRSGISEAF